MAQKTMLETTELREAILLQLPCKDLLLAQRVCRTWQITIRDSVQLQKALFLTPSKPILEGSEDGGDYTDGEARYSDFQNSTIRFYPEKCTGVPVTHLRLWTNGNICSINTPHARAEINPMLDRLLPKTSEKGWQDTSIEHRSRHYVKINSNPAFNYSEASWRKMLVSDPPVKRLYLDCTAKTPVQGPFRPVSIPVTAYRKLANESGVTIQDVMSAAAADDAQFSYRSLIKVAFCFYLSWDVVDGNISDDE